MKMLKYLDALRGVVTLTQESRDHLLEYSTYLLSSEHSYSDLHGFLKWFGETYLMPSIIKAIDRVADDEVRLYDLGSGSKWLIDGVRNYFPSMYCHSLDKREENNPDMVVDLEENLEGFREFVSMSRNIFVACHFLHCVENYQEIINTLGGHWIVIEPDFRDLDNNWAEQLKMRGVIPLSNSDIEAMFYSAGFSCLDSFIVLDQRIWVFSNI